MTKRELQLAVLERDNCLCQDCGKYTTETHHIVSRGRKGAWCMKNMITLCPMCHRGKNKQAGAHSKTSRAHHLRLLRDKHGYEYSEQPWRGMILE